ncbi:MAG: serine hydrolase, partial [Clostridia bacterium]
MQLLETVRTPEDAGCSSKEILRFLDAAHAAGVEFHSMLILRHGKVACRLNWAPYDDHTPHILFSLSKSFCSAAAGF